MTADRAAYLAKLKPLKGCHITTERDRALEEQLTGLLEVDPATGRQLASPVRFAGGLETRGIAMIEPSGGGKTTAVHRLLSQTEALAPTATRSHPLYLMVQVPSPATLKSLGLAILGAINVTGLSRQNTAWKIWEVVRTRLNKLGIVVLWIDEAQDLFLSRSAREIDDMLKTLKSLMQGPDALILILSGTERLFQITSYDPQVDRRLGKVVPRDLLPTDESKVASLISRFAGLAGLEVDLAASVSLRLIYAARRRFGRVVDTIISAIGVALSDGAGTLKIEHFAEAWAMAEGGAWEKNIFVTPNWASIVLDAAAAEFDAARTKRQRKKLEQD